MRYAILGLGALGGYYGGRLAKAGHDVHFLARSEYDAVSRHGLRVDSKQGDFLLPHVAVYRNPQDLPPCDVAIVCWKTTANDALPNTLPHVLAPGGVALSLQNGLGNEAALAEVVGPDRVLGGVCQVCINRIAPGHIHHLDYGAMRLAEYRADGQPGGITPRLEAIVADLRSAGLTANADPDLVSVRFRKLVWNVPFNGLSVVLNATTDQLMAQPATRRLAERLMHEVLAIARVLGRDLGDGLVAEMMEHTAAMTPYKTSMKIDYDEGRPLETDAIFSAPLRLGQAHGLALPFLDMLASQLTYLGHAVRTRIPPARLTG